MTIDGSPKTYGAIATASRYLGDEDPCDLSRTVLQKLQSEATIAHADGTTMATWTHQSH